MKTSTMEKMSTMKMMTFNDDIDDDDDDDDDDEAWYVYSNLGREADTLPRNTAASTRAFDIRDIYDLVPFSSYPLIIHLII